MSVAEDGQKWLEELGVQVQESIGLTGMTNMGAHQCYSGRCWAAGRHQGCLGWGDAMTVGTTDTDKM